MTKYRFFILLPANFFDKKAFIELLSHTDKSQRYWNYFFIDSLFKNLS